MKSRTYKNDKKKRYLYKTTEIFQKVLKALKLFSGNKKPHVLVVCNILYLKSVKIGFKNQSRNYCIITGRSRGVYSKLRVSRLSLRKIGSEGLFFGLKKSSW